MTEAEEIFKSKLDKIIGEYCPNKSSLIVISHVITGLMVEAFKESGQSVSDVDIQITQMDIGSFIKSLKDISIYVSQDIVENVLKDTYKNMKNLIPLRKANISEKVVNEVSVNTPNYESNEVSFDIDIESIPKISKKEKIQSNEFTGNGVSIDFDKFNSYKPDIEISVSTESNVEYTHSTGSEVDESIEDDSTFTTDGSMFTSESYEDIPNMSVGLDY